MRTRSNLAFILSLGMFFGGCTAKKGAAPAPAGEGIGAHALAEQPASKEVVYQYVAAMRADLSQGKTRLIDDVMKLSNDEAKIFWATYHEYETELFDLGDTRVEGIRQFAEDERNGTLDNAGAAALATAYFDYESRRLELLKKYHDLITEQLSPVRAAQFTQVEHRVGTVVDLLIAAELPLIAPDTPPLSRGD